MTESDKLLNATCPECRGPLRESSSPEAPKDYLCLVGHRYSAGALLSAHSEAQEKALWAAVVALEEGVNIVRDAATEFTPEVAEALLEQAKKCLAEAALIRDILQRLEPFHTR